MPISIDSSLTVVAKKPKCYDFPGIQYLPIRQSAQIPLDATRESKVVPISLTPCYENNPNYCGWGEAWDAIKPIFYGGQRICLPLKNVTAQIVPGRGCLVLAAGRINGTLTTRLQRDNKHEKANI